MFNEACRKGLGRSAIGGIAKPEPEKTAAEQSAPAESVTEELVFFAADNRDETLYPFSKVRFRHGAPSCSSRCGTEEKTHTSLKSYINIMGVSETLRWTPVAIDLREYPDYESWERPVKKRYDRVRMKNRSVRGGFVVHPYHHKLHIPDIYEIHHSTEIRSGGKMRGDYLAGIEEMGGAPTAHYKLSPPPCPLHWSMSFGVFEPKQSHQQGEIVTDEKLVGYINLRRIGDVALYSRIMGHGDYLNEGVMYHLHFDIVKWLMDPENALADGLKFLMYGGIGNGGPNLWQWKRTAGFKPYRLMAEPGL